MPWPRPIYSRKEVDEAGGILGRPIDKVDPGDFAWAIEVANNWRAIHGHPLNTFQWWLRRHAPDNAVVAQRIKRLISIALKLYRLKWLTLSKMQDLGGCRAVVENNLQVTKLWRAYATSEIKHELVGEPDDYITSPKKSGYRGLHLIYRYNSDKIDTYNGLQIEVQLRSRIQHAWATAVEVVGTFLDQPLKSSLGSAEWLKFFKLTSSAFAVRERSALVPGTPTNPRELRRAVRAAAEELNVVRVLDAYGKALSITQAPEHSAASYFLLELDATVPRLTVETFRAGELGAATERYSQVEEGIRGKPGAQAVLVRSGQLKDLRRAYPNYYLDTETFSELLRDAIS